MVRDLSSITGRGGGGGQVKFYPNEKGIRYSFSHAEGGWGTKSVGVVLAQELDVLAIVHTEGVGAQQVSAL